MVRSLHAATDACIAFREPGVERVDAAWMLHGCSMDVLKLGRPSMEEIGKIPEVESKCGCPNDKLAEFPTPEKGYSLH